MGLSAGNVRKRILTMGYNCGRSVHVGGSLSMVELLTVLYRDIMKYDVQNPEWADRDRFILSKGHCVLALYAVLAELGVLSDEDVSTYMQDGSHFGSHPVMDLAHGIECSSGSLGQGVSMAVGIAKAAKLKSSGFRVYAMVGNGEMNEGSVWEAMMLASQWKLDNLTFIVDNNCMQSDGTSSGIIDLSRIDRVVSELGIQTIRVDGHDEDAVRNAFEVEIVDAPKMIVADTVKGKGISFMENNNEWHHNRITQSIFDTVMEEISSC